MPAKNKFAVDITDVLSLPKCMIENSKAETSNAQYLFIEAIKFVNT